MNRLDISKSNSKISLEENTENIENMNIDELKQIDKILQRTEFSRYHLKVYLASLLMRLSMGGQVVMMSLLSDILSTQWLIDDLKTGLIGSSLFIGLFLGTVISGKFSDKYGRNPTFQIGVSISVISPTWEILVIFRTIFGFGCGLSIPSITALLSEICTTKWRGWIMNVMWMFFSAGAFVIVLEAKFVLVYQIYGWRLLIFISTLPCLLLFLISFHLFESPRFHLSNENYDQVFSILNLFLSSNEMQKLNEVEKRKIIEENQIFLNNNNYKAQYKEILNKDFLRLTILCAIIYFICSFLLYGLISIHPQELTKSQLKYDLDSMYNSIIFTSIFSIPSSVAGAFLANSKTFGRVKTLFIGFIFSLIFSILCLIEIGNTPFFIFCLRFSILITDFTINVYAVEAYPTKFRTIGYGATYSFTRLGGFITVLVNQLAFSSNKNLPFFILMIASIIGVISSYLLPYETLGKEIK